MSTVTFYASVAVGWGDAYHTYDAAKLLAALGEDFETTQMCMLNNVKDYDLIRIVDWPYDVIEIVNNHDGTYYCDRTDKEIRRAHNLFRLWESGEFDEREDS